MRKGQKLTERQKLIRGLKANITHTRTYGLAMEVAIETGVLPPREARDLLRDRLSDRDYWDRLQGLQHALFTGDPTAGDREAKALVGKMVETHVAVRDQLRGLLASVEEKVAAELH